MMITNMSANSKFKSVNFSYTSSRIGAQVGVEVDNQHMNTLTLSHFVLHNALNIG